MRVRVLTWYRVYNQGTGTVAGREDELTEALVAIGSTPAGYAFSCTWRARARISVVHHAAALVSGRPLNVNKAWLFASEAWF